MSSIRQFGTRVGGLHAQHGVTTPDKIDLVESSHGRPSTEGREPLFGSSYAVRAHPYHGPESFPRMKAPLRVKTGSVAFPSFDTMCVAYRQGSKRGYAYGTGVRTNGYKNAVLGKNEPSSLEPPPTRIGVAHSSGGDRAVTADPNEHELNPIAQRGAGRIANNMYSISGGYQRMDPSREQAVSIGPYGYDVKRPGTSTMDGGWDAGLTNMHPPFQSTGVVGQDTRPLPSYGLREPRPVRAAPKFGDYDRQAFDPNAYKPEYTTTVHGRHITQDRAYETLAEPPATAKKPRRRKPSRYPR